MKKIFLLILLCPLFFACSMFSESRETHFFLDSDGFCDCDFWQISVFDGENEILFSMENGADSFSLDLPKNVALGILAYPVKNGRRQKPFGAIYPYSVEISCKDGFAAYIVDRLYRGSRKSVPQTQDFVSRFNWPRFVESCAAFENPWNLDGDRIVKSIASGRFKKSDFKLRTAP